MIGDGINDAPEETAAEFIDVWLHGPRTYTGRYDKQTLFGWAGAFSFRKRQGKDIFCYFNNDAQGHAPRNALALKQMLEP